MEQKEILKKHLLLISTYQNRTVGLPLFDNQLDLVTNVYLKGNNYTAESTNLTIMVVFMV